jgi:hypothetical protein
MFESGCVETVKLKACHPIYIKTLRTAESYQFGYGTEGCSKEKDYEPVRVKAGEKYAWDTITSIWMCIKIGAVSA